MKKLIAILLTLSFLFIIVPQSYVLALENINLNTVTSKMNISFNGTYVYGITETTTAEELKTLLNNEINVDKISTGGELDYNGAKYTIVIKGDINGDGKIGVVDYLYTKRAFMGTIILSETQLKAACLGGTELPTSSDYLKIKRHLIGTYNIFNSTESKHIVVRFAAMSDIHLNGLSTQTEYKRFEQALDFMNSYSESQDYKNFDALVVAGDMTNYGYQKELQAFATVVDNKLSDSTEKVFVMGNHEYNGYSSAYAQSLWESTLGVSKNTHKKINGFHFIGVSLGNTTDYTYITSWLDEELAKAASDAPDKPIFVIQHKQITGTVYGSETRGTTQLTSILNKYPQIVDFSGHSHFPINDPRSINQDIFTTLVCGSLSYIKLERGMIYGTIPPKASNAAQFFVVEVYSDGSVVFKPYDLITRQFFPTEYSIENPTKPGSFKYIDARYELADIPVFPQGTTLDISNITETGCKLSFGHATDGENVHSYRYDFYLKSDGTKKVTFKTWSEFYFLNRPDTMTYTTNLLTPGTDYRVTVTAIDSFGKESVVPIEATFKTTGVSPVYDSKVPDANVLDIVFGLDGAKDEGILSKTVENFNTKIEADSTFGGVYVAKFTGYNDYLRIKFTGEDYVKYNQTITIASKIMINEFPESYSDAFSNMESGGYGFEINGRTRQIEFWIEIGGSYRILAVDAVIGEYYSLVGTYDGSFVKLYVNGALAGTEKATGLITYPSATSAYAFCIGSDINKYGEGDAFFNGNVAYAKVFDNALTADQAVNLSKSY